MVPRSYKTKRFTILLFQAKLALHAPPVVLTTAIFDEQKKMTSVTDPIINKPKPKPPKVEPPPDTEAKKDEAKMDTNPVNGEGEVKFHDWIVLSRPPCCWSSGLMASILD